MGWLILSGVSEGKLEKNPQSPPQRQQRQDREQRQNGQSKFLDLLGRRGFLRLCALCLFLYICRRLSYRGSLGRERFDDFLTMFHQNLVDKHICLLNLGKLPCACNNDRAGVKGADGNLFTLAQGGTIPVSCTQSITTRADSLHCIRRRCLVIEILCITPLINGGFKAAEQVILTHENLM